MFPQEHHILSPDIWAKTFTNYNWFKKCWWIASYIFSILYNLIHFSLPLNPAIHKWQNGQYTEIFCVLDVKKKKSVNPNLYFIADFQDVSRLLISELIINLKYTFNILFRIALKTIIMGTSSQLYDDALLKFYPRLAQRYYTLLDCVKEALCNVQFVMCNFTNFLRLTLTQYGKAFSLSASPVAY